MYDQKKQVEAWRAFVTNGTIDESVVRPEIARSWRRCRAAGVNPWSTHFPEMDERLLREKQQQFEHSLVANTPVMLMLMALLNCNVSLMDQENFVFGFQSPLSYYPRTFGTYVLEEEVGTGNATIVPYEKKPVRVEGFEQYRAISQTYSGVSVPFLDSRNVYYGAMNLNDPFEMLPDNALDLCAAGVDLANDLFLAGQRMWSVLSTVEFFNPLLQLTELPVLALDNQGHILAANNLMRPCLPRFESYSYGSQSLSDYLSKKNTLDAVMREHIKDGEPMPVHFRDGRKKGEKTLGLLRRRNVDLGHGLNFNVLVFSSMPGAQDKAVVGQPARKSLGRTASKDVVNYIGQSAEWNKVDTLVKKVAPIKTNVMLLGETGTGKEVVARALHRLSGRKGAFVAINCGAIPRDLFAAELFGYESGAFTGAKEGGAAGKIEAANGGTLFLDEIGEMPLDLQVGLLRVIQEQSVMRLGSPEPRQLDVRFLAATNQRIRDLVDERKFRADLYYRLSMVEIELPPLRCREGDVELLVDFFNKELSEQLGLPYSAYRPEVMCALASYSWPGNVRELRNVVERSLIMAGEGALVSLDDLPAHVANSIGINDPIQQPMASMRQFVLSSREASRIQETPQAPDADRAEERARIIELVARHNGNISQVAKEMGISRNTLYRRMEALKLRIKVTVEVEE